MHDFSLLATLLRSIFLSRFLFIYLLLIYYLSIIFTYRLIYLLHIYLFSYLLIYLFTYHLGALCAVGARQTRSKMPGGAACGRGRGGPAAGRRRTRRDVTARRDGGRGGTEGPRAGDGVRRRKKNYRALEVVS